MLTVFSVVAELSTEDPHIVGYVSDTISLPCEHNLTKSDLQTLYWTKDTVKIVAEYDQGDDKPVQFHHPFEGRVNVKVFPPTLTISNVALHDGGVYQCNIIPVKGKQVGYRYKVTVNGRELLYLESHVPLSCVPLHKYSLVRC